MKSKKKMLLALGAMSAAAIGAGATSTFAWFAAQSSATVAFQSSAGSESLSAGTTTLSSKNIYIKVVAAPHGSVKLSTKDGKTFAHQGDKLIEGTDAVTTLYDYITFTCTAYSDEECETGVTAEDLQYVSASGDAFAFTIKGGARTRLAWGAPANQGAFATKFANIGDDAETTVYGVLAQNGTITLYQEDSHTNNITTSGKELYYSIAGMLSSGATGDDLVAASVSVLWNTAEGAVQQKDAGTSLTQTLTLAAA